MLNVGPLELVVVLIIALIVLGPQRLPDVARSVGRGMREFRNALESPDDDEYEDDDGPELEPDDAVSAASQGDPLAPNEADAAYQNEADSSESSSSSSERV